MTTQLLKTNVINSQVKPQTQKILKIDLSNNLKLHQSLTSTKDLGRSTIPKQTTNVKGGAASNLKKFGTTSPKKRPMIDKTKVIESLEK